MRVVNNDAIYHQSNTPEKCLETAEQERKRKYLSACVKKRRHFTLFVTSVDGLLGVEADATLKRIAVRLAQKCQEVYSRNLRYVKSRLNITLVRGTQKCIWEARVPVSHISVTQPQR